MTDTPDLADTEIDALRAVVRVRPDIVTADTELMGLVRGALASDGVVDLAGRQSHKFCIQSLNGQKPPTRR